MQTISELCAEIVSLQFQLAGDRAEIARLRAIIAARRKHQGQIQEAAHKLYKRFGKDDADVMDVWSLAVINPEPPSDADIQRAKELKSLGQTAPRGL